MESVPAAADPGPGTADAIRWLLPAVLGLSFAVTAWLARAAPLFMLPGLVVIAGAIGIERHRRRNAGAWRVDEAGRILVRDGSGNERPPPISGWTILPGCAVVDLPGGGTGTRKLVITRAAVGQVVFRRLCAGLKQRAGWLSGPLAAGADN